MYDSDKGHERALLQVFPELAPYTNECFFMGNIMNYHNNNLLYSCIKYGLLNFKRVVVSIGEGTQPMLLEWILREFDVVIDELNITTPYPSIFFIGSHNLETIDKFYSWASDKNIKHTPGIIFGCQHDELHDLTDLNPEIPTGIREKKYLCLNRIPRHHRMMLVVDLHETKLSDYGLISFGGTKRYFENFPELMPKLKKYVDSWPLTLDIDDLENTNPKNTEFEAEQLHRRTYFSVVTETIFYNATKTQPDYDWEVSRYVFPATFKGDVFFSEKIYKPISFKHPFLLFGVPNSLSIFKSFGYKTFDRWFDESYDSIDNPNLRYKFLLSEIKRLVALSDEQWVEMIHEMTPVLEYNYNHFLTKPYDRRITKDAIKYFKE